MKMLDLAGTEAGPSVDLDVQGAGAAAAADAAPEQCIENLDEWDVDRGRRLAEESPKLQQLGTSEPAAADFFGAAFKIEPRLAEGCADKRRHDFMKALMESSDF